MQWFNSKVLKHNRLSLKNLFEVRKMDDCYHSIKPAFFGFFLQARYV